MRFAEKDNYDLCLAAADSTESAATLNDTLEDHYVRRTLNRVPIVYSAGDNVLAISPEELAVRILNFPVEN